VASTVVKFKKKNKRTSPLKQTKTDRWINPSSGFGGEADPMSRTYFGRDFNITQSQLDSLYEEDWVAGRVIDIPAKDATRKWLDLTHDTDNSKIEKMTEEFTRLDVQAKFNEAIILSRLYGGCAMIIGAFDGQEVDQPLGTIQSVDWIENVDRFHAYPATFYQDPDDPRFGLPEMYTIQRLAVIGSHTMSVHESRIIRFEGNYLPPRLRIKNFGWSAPVFQKVREALRQFGVSIQSGASILQDFITMAMKIDNLSEMVRDDTGEAELRERMAIVASERSTHNIMLYGSDEEIEKMGSPVSGLKDLMDIFFDVVSAAAEIPKSRFFHNESGRLGGDAGENDLRTHYDNIAAFQVNQLSSRVTRIADIVAEPLGYLPGEIKHTWQPLWQLSESEIAKQYNDTATGDVAYITAGVLQPEEVAVFRFGGESLNLVGMSIDPKRREKIIKALNNAPIDEGEILNEPDDDPNPEPDDPDDEENNEDE